MVKNEKLIEKLNDLRKKYDGNYGTKNEAYARLLKRRRLEQNKTLEEVASGVCSTSYLCRIENAQVEVDDLFFDHLFEKLEISYDEVKKQNETNILKDLLKRYLERDYERMSKLANYAIDSKIYSDVELKLITLFINIVEEHYEESKMIIMDIEKVFSTLVGSELILYTFLSALLSYRTNNVYSSYKLIRVLEGIIFEDEIIKEAVYDLALSVYSLLDEDLLFTKTYYNIKGISNRRLNNKIITIHELENSLIEGKNNYSYGLELFYEISDVCVDDYLKEAYYYNICKLYSYYKKFDLCFKLFEEAPMTSKMICLLDYAINNCDNLVKAVGYLSTLKEFQFNKYESFHLFYNELTIKKIEKLNNLEFTDFIKRNFNNKKYNSAELKNCEIIKNIEYLNKCSLYELGKYKEIAKSVLELSS